MDEIKINFRVGKNTEVNKLASAIFTNMKNVDRIKLCCIGAASTQQAMKALATANGMSNPSGFQIFTIPHFDQVEIRGEEKTSLVFTLAKIMN